MKMLKRHICKYWIFYAALAFPALLFRFDPERWRARLISVSLLSSLGVLTPLIYALNPKIRMVKPEGKLWETKHAKRNVLIVECIARLFFIMLSLGIAGGFGWPLVRNCSKWPPETKWVTGYVKYTSSAFGTRWLAQSFELHQDNGEIRKLHFFMSDQTLC